MNRFTVVSCLDVEAGDDMGINYTGPIVVLACASDIDFALFFPFTQENAEIIKLVLQNGVNFNVNTSVLGIYKTMIDSWQASDRYLSGIIMDSVSEDGDGEEMLSINLALADSDGDLDGLVKINFVHAVLLSVIESVDILVTDKLISRLLPKYEDNDDSDGDPKEKSQSFPEDKKILGIVKDIMSGQIKD